MFTDTEMLLLEHLVLNLINWTAIKKSMLVVRDKRRLDLYVDTKIS